MSTDGNYFTDQPEISTTIYSELVIITPSSGTAINTICDERTGECIEGPSPSISIRRLAYNKYNSVKKNNNTKKTLIADSANVAPSVLLQQNYSLKPHVDIKSQRIHREFNELIRNYSSPEYGSTFTFKIIFPNYDRDVMQGVTPYLSHPAGGMDVNMLRIRFNNFVIATVKQPNLKNTWLFKKPLGYINIVAEQVSTEIRKSIYSAFQQAASINVDWPRLSQQASEVIIEYTYNDYGLIYSITLARTPRGGIFNIDCPDGNTTLSQYQNIPGGYGLYSSIGMESLSSNSVIISLDNVYRITGTGSMTFYLRDITDIRNNIFDKFYTITSNVNNTMSNLSEQLRNLNIGFDVEYSLNEYLYDARYIKIVNDRWINYPNNILMCEVTLNVRQISRPVFLFNYNVDKLPADCEEEIDFNSWETYTSQLGWNGNSCVLNNNIAIKTRATFSSPATQIDYLVFIRDGQLFAYNVAAFDFNFNNLNINKSFTLSNQQFVFNYISFAYGSYSFASIKYPGSITWLRRVIDLEISNQLVASGVVNANQVYYQDYKSSTINAPIDETPVIINAPAVEVIKYDSVEDCIYLINGNGAIVRVNKLIAFSSNDPDIQSKQDTTVLINPSKINGSTMLIKAFDIDIKDINYTGNCIYTSEVSFDTNTLQIVKYILQYNPTSLKYQVLDRLILYTPLSFIDSQIILNCNSLVYNRQFNHLYFTSGTRIARIDLLQSSLQLKSVIVNPTTNLTDISIDNSCNVIRVLSSNLDVNDFPQLPHYYTTKIKNVDISSLIWSKTKFSDITQIPTAICRLSSSSNIMSKTFYNLDVGKYVLFKISVSNFTSGKIILQLRNHSVIVNTNTVTPQVSSSIELSTYGVVQNDGIMIFNIIYVGDIGITSNIRINHVRICYTPNLLSCQSGNQTVNSSNFDVDNGGWLGGILDTSLGIIKSQNINTNNTSSKINQVFATLTANKFLYVSGRFGPKYQINGDDINTIKYRIIFESTGIVYSSDLKTYQPQETFTAEFAIPSNGIVKVTIEFVVDSNNIGNRQASIDQLLVCQSTINVPQPPQPPQPPLPPLPPPPLPPQPPGPPQPPIPGTGSGNVCGIRAVKHGIYVDGISQSPTNVFASYIKYKMRDPDDPLKFGYVIQLPIYTMRTTAACNKWVQQIASEYNILRYTGNLDDQLVSTSRFNNWLWNIHPGDGVQDFDELRVYYPNPEQLLDGRKTYGDISVTLSENDPNFKKCVIEQIEIFYLMNVLESTPSTPQNGSGLCNVEASNLIGTIYYDNNRSSNYFQDDISISQLRLENVDSLGNWIAGSGNGIRGSAASWINYSYVLDTSTGAGLDQCTQPIGGDFVATGTINLTFDNIQCNFEAFHRNKCIPFVYVEPIREGGSVNEIQSIVLPNPSAGRWNITVNINGQNQTTVSLPYNANAAQLQSRLSNLINIGDGNVTVSGNGKSFDPYIVEFVNDLSGTSISTMIASSIDLRGTADAIFTTIQNGTKNERQRLYRTSSTVLPYRLIFNGQQTIPISYNAPINTVRNALEALPAIGVGNIIISGSTTDLYSEYEGVLYFDFIGSLSNQNVPQILVTSQSNSYITATDWNGGVGVNEIQRLTINASGGVFTITLYDPADATGNTFATTPKIQYDASALDMKSAIITVCSWLSSSDINVSKPADNVWQLTFVGNYQRVDIKQSTVNSAQLTGGSIVVESLQQGGSSQDIQRVSIINATGGSFTLQLNVPGIGYRTTSSIPARCSTVDIKSALVGLDGIFPQDVQVFGSNPFNIRFREQLGDIDLMTADFTMLECDPAILPQVPEPPYLYEIPKSAYEPPLAIEPRPPLSDFANRYNSYIIQRDLFNPLGINSNKRLRDIVLTKRINISEYTPYYKDCNSQLLIRTTYDTFINSMTSYVLVHNLMVNDNINNRFFEILKKHTILPSRSGC